MTPRDARKAGGEWGVSIARAWYAGDEATARVYAERMKAQHAALPASDIAAAFWQAQLAAYDAEWARLEGETGQ